jgi:hypothetical protein
MAAIVIRGNARLTGLAGLASVRAKACDMAQQGMARAAAAVMVGAIGAALVQLAVQILSFPAPVAVPGLTVMAAALLFSLRRLGRSQQSRASVRPGHRPGWQHRRERLPDPPPRPAWLAPRMRIRCRGE